HNLQKKVLKEVQWVYKEGGVSLRGFNKDNFGAGFQLSKINNNLLPIQKLLRGCCDCSDTDGYIVTFQQLQGTFFQGCARCNDIVNQQYVFILNFLQILGEEYFFRFKPKYPCFKNLRSGL